MGSDFSFVDLFAGCGGLSLGLRAAGGSEVLAVERARDAAHSLFTNLISSELSFEDHLALSPAEQIDGGLLADSVESLLSLEWKPSTAVDVVVGGPPCQGFSLAGRRDQTDERNQLVWRFLEIVQSLDPRIVVVENVEGMNRRFVASSAPAEVDERSTFAQVLQALSSTGRGYVTQGLRVNAMHYGAAQHRPRLMAVGIRADLAASLGIVQQPKIWESSFQPIIGLPMYAPMPTVFSSRTVSDAIGDLADRVPSDWTDHYLQELTTIFAPWVNSRPTELPMNNEHRGHRAATRRRFKVLQRIESLGGSARLLGPMSEAHRADAMIQLRAAVERDEIPFFDDDRALNAGEFIELVGQLANSKHSQRPLRWNAPARTVMTIPDDHVHPSEPRTFSVREMARFQGFPDNFLFEGKATTGGTSRRVDVPQYSQVGNAVSPFVAKAVGEMVKSVLAASAQAD